MLIASTREHAAKVTELDKARTALVAADATVGSLQRQRPRDEKAKRERSKTLKTALSERDALESQVTTLADEAATLLVEVDRIGAEITQLVENEE